MSLFRELRNRHVFRVMGLYAGIAWVIVEASGVVLPVFGFPDIVFRGIVILAIAGIPVAAILAYIFEFTDRGIERHEVAVAHAEALPATGRDSRVADFVVIGVLLIALGFSVYLNFNLEPAAVGQRVPLSLVVADFDNQTGNALFDGVIEQALVIGLEGAPFVTAFSRKQALKTAAQIRPGATLDTETARLVSVREGVGAVLSGKVLPSGSSFKLTAQVLEPVTGDVLASAKSSASDITTVLQSVGDLARELRLDLGDVTAKESAELFTAGSLEAAHAYSEGQELALAGDDEKAMESYAQAIKLDPGFGRAYSGQALSAHKLGRLEISDELWAKALPHIDRMTPRERLRTLGLYYLTVTRNYAKAVENYQELVELYPADSGGFNNLAIALFYDLDFAAAREAGRRAMEIYPAQVLFKANFALYAMYASDFEAAVVGANEVIASDPEYAKAYLPLAMAALHADNITAAHSAYDEMSKTGSLGASLAGLGHSDALILAGEYKQAIELLQAGITEDTVNKNTLGLASKFLALADAYFGADEPDTASASLDEALALLRHEAQLVPAARLYLQMGRVEEARELAEEMRKQLSRQQRAYAAMIEASIARLAGNTTHAIDKLREAISLADLWLVRYELGLAYAAAGLPAEAMSEFDDCQRRIGEATSLFFDDLPTWRITADLQLNLAAARKELGMNGE